MARKTLTDEQILSRYSTMWLPKNTSKKSLSDGEQNTIDLVELAKKDEKGFDALIKKLRNHHEHKEIEMELEELIINRELTRDWKDRSGLDGKIEKLWEEYRALESIE